MMLDYDYPMNINNNGGPAKQMSSEIKVKKKSRGARKNLIHLANQGGVQQRPATQINDINSHHNHRHQDSSYSNNLNRLLDEMDKQDEQNCSNDASAGQDNSNPFSLAPSPSPYAQSNTNEID